MNTTIRHQSVPFTIASGTDGVKVDIRLLEGTAVKVALFTDGALPNQLVNLSLRDNGGKRLEDATSLKNWEQRSGGNYLDSLKPINIDGGQIITLEFTALSNLAAALTGQVVFVIEQNC